MKLEEIKPLHPKLDEVIVVAMNGSDYQRLLEGKLVSGRFPRNIRVDHPTHLQRDGQQHAHVLGRRGDEVGIVNFDGSGSHGSKFTLHDKDALTLRSLGFVLPPDNVIEWATCDDARKLLIG